VPTFRLDGSKLLAVDLANETVATLAGSMVAYEGRIEFQKRGMGASGGIRGALKRAATGEGISLMDCKGSGTVYIAKDANEITVIDLQGDKLWIESSNLIALEPSLKMDQVFTGLRGATSGNGLFTTTVEGTGKVAMLSDGPAIVLSVQGGMPLIVDPQAYVAHTGQLTQDFMTDVTWRTAAGQGSGEAFQLRFQGQGTVWIQPAERAGGLDV